MAGKKPRARRAQGEGSLTQRENGLWVARLELPRDPLTGKRRWKSFTSMSKADAVAKMNKGKRALEDHGDMPTGSETVEKWLAYWLDSIDESRPSTRAGYRSSISNYIVPVIGKVRIDALVPDDIEKVERFVLRTRGLSQSVARTAYHVLSKSLKDAYVRGRVTRNVATLVRKPKLAPPKLKTLTAEDAITVIRSVTEDRLGSRWAAALLTGARQGEMLGLTWDRVDFDENTIDLSWQLQRIAWLHGCPPTTADGWTCGRPRGTDCSHRRLDVKPHQEYQHITGGLYFSRPKTKAGIRLIPLVEPLRSILIRRAAASLTEPNPHNLVWTSDPKHRQNTPELLPLDGSPIDPSRDNKAWHAVLESAGVADAAGVGQVPLHAARHTAVTLLYELGVPETIIQDIVGQSTVLVTRSYRNKSQKPLREALEGLGAVLSGALTQ